VSDEEAVGLLVIAVRCMYVALLLPCCRKMFAFSLFASI